MIIASTLASAAAGSRIDSARIVRELAKDRGASSKLQSGSTARSCPWIRPRESMHAQRRCRSDDSDLRNVAHTGTTLTSAGLAIGQRMVLPAKTCSAQS